jgi:hypothetical protein
MPDASVDAIVTDPPYGLRFMGKKWDYDVPTTEVWAECLRVLKPGGHLLAFAGTRTQHRMAVRIEDAGFEIRDLIMYCYGSGFPKSTDISRRIDLEEQKRWLDVSKALDNLETAAIMEAWKDHSKAASTAGLSFAKSPTATGISTPKSGFAPEPVLLQADQESSDALALVAELSFKEAHLTSKAEINSAPMPAAANESQDPVKCAEHSLKRSNAISTNAGIAQCAVKEWPSASMGGNLKAVEALRIWLGSKPSSMQAVTNALCAVLTADLKHITLSQSKTFQSFDTTRQTACASAISVTITESMAESLISFTVDTLRKQAIDRAAGAEREVTAPATDAARRWQGWGTALKPALEPITVARKPLEGTVAANVLQWGTGGINVDGCRVGTDLITQHGRGDSANIAMSGRNYAEEAGRKWTGRWPANLIHDGSEEVVGLFPQGRSSGIYSPTDHSQGKRAKWVINFGGMGVPSVMYSDSGSAARFFYTAKADATDRNDGLSPGERNKHPTVKPVDLMCYLCRLVTPPGGIVLDPFMGSGSTGKACVTEGFSFIGIERDADSFATAQARVVSPMPLFKDVL